MGAVNNKTQKRNKILLVRYIFNYSTQLLFDFQQSKVPFKLPQSKLPFVFNYSRYIRDFFLKKVKNI